jgi:hypothetical protein
MYWEGRCPEWIRDCQHTVFGNAQDVRLLGPDEFDRLRETDRDIDLSRLYVAHRADFIRAFLLARFGGLWVDSDCVVMKPLGPVLDLLETHGFLGYFERQGRIANNFFGSRPRGLIAVAYYERVCHILRSGQHLKWLSLGACALMDTLEETKGAWHQMPVELVQPVCWSNPQAFFTVDSLEGHDRVFNPRSVCYMLSNHMVNGYARAHPGADLRKNGTFFRYLLDRLSNNDD